MAPLRVAVLLSGGGRTLQNLIDRIASEALPLQVQTVIANTARAFGLERARTAGIPSEVIRCPRRGDPAEQSARIFAAVRAAGAEWVLLAGFLRLLAPIPADFQGRVLNIHPSLIPAFAGPGFYGERVHQAALARGVRVSGCTVHFVDDEYDHGPILVQRSVPVEPGDTPASLAARVFEAECQAYPEAIRLLASGSARWESGSVVWGSEG